MERKNCLSLIMGIALSLSLSAQNQPREDIYHSYLANQMTTWKVILEQFELKRPNHANQLIELINYQYGYIGATV